MPNFQSNATLTGLDALASLQLQYEEQVRLTRRERTEERDLDAEEEQNLQGRVNKNPAYQRFSQARKSNPWADYKPTQKTKAMSESSPEADDEVEGSPLTAEEEHQDTPTLRPGLEPREEAPPTGTSQPAASQEDTVMDVESEGPDHRTPTGQEPPEYPQGIKPYVHPGAPSPDDNVLENGGGNGIRGTLGVRCHQGSPWVPDPDAFNHTGRMVHRCQALQLHHEAL